MHCGVFANASHLIALAETESQMGTKKKERKRGMCVSATCVRVKD